MPKFVRYYPDGVNVLDEAKARLRHAYKNFDHVVISFSGGKDSLALLELAREIAIDELQVTDKVEAWFRDEEVIPNIVADFVESMKDLPWLDLHWWAVPLRSVKAAFGVTERYIQWDPARDPANGGVGFVRDLPPWAVTLDTLGLPADTVLSQYTADAAFADSLLGRGSIVQAIGIRCTESLLRYAAIVNGGSRGRRTWLTTPERMGNRKRLVAMGRPIYDWAENDVFRLFYERGVRYCSIYDTQMWLRREMRVATSLTTQNARMLDRLRVTDPAHFERLAKVFPEVESLARYNADFDHDALIDRIGVDWETLTAWVEEHQTGDLYDKAMEFIRYHRKWGEEGKPAFPVHEAAARLVRGDHQRGAGTASVGAGV